MNIRNGGDVAVDPEGAEYSSLQEAREDALAGARELGAAALKAGSSLDVIMHKVFEIRGEDGVLLLTILFSEAFR